MSGLDYQGSKKGGKWVNKAGKQVGYSAEEDTQFIPTKSTGDTAMPMHKDKMPKKMMPMDKMADNKMRPIDKTMHNKMQPMDKIADNKMMRTINPLAKAAKAKRYRNQAK